MAYADLQEFVRVLEDNGELRRISTEADPVLEITEITDRVSKRGGPALLFERVKGSPYPLLINAFGSIARMHLALEVDSLEAIAAEVQRLLEPELPGSLLESLRMLPRLKRMGHAVPRIVRSGKCQEVVETEGALLDQFPIMQCWPEDAGRFITLPVVVTKHPATGSRNVGMYRMQVFDAVTTGMHWHVHKGGAQHYRVAEAMGQKLEVAVALGPDPAVTYAATAPLPEDVDEFMFAGFLRKRPVELVKCKTVDLEVPANAQIVLEGYVLPGERRREGPFGDHTGFYSAADEYPVFHITCVTHSRDPIYPSTIVGIPPMEDAYFAKATERIFLPVVQKQLPEIVDISLPAEGVFHNLAIVSIEKRYPGHAQKVMHALWGLGQMIFTKVLVVVNAEVNVQDPKEVVWVVGNNIDPRRDVVFADGPADVLDHASPIPCFGSKMGIDATRKWPEEGFTRPWPDPIRMSQEVKARVDALWPELGL